MYCGDQHSETLGASLKPLDFKQVSEDYFVAETSIGQYEIDKREDDEDDGLVWFLWTPFKDYGDRFRTFEEAAEIAWGAHRQAVLPLFNIQGY